MTYEQINDAMWSDTKPKLSPAEKRAYDVIQKLNDFGGFDHWWDCIEDVDDQNEIFKALVKVCK